MRNDPTPFPAEPSDPPPVPVTGRMLRIALGGEQPLVEAALRAIAAEGESWWPASFRAVGAVRGAALPPLHPGRSGLAELERWKEAAKAWARRKDPADAPVRGTVVYLAATALALRDHGRSLSSRPASELIPAWLDLAGAAPHPWDEVLAQAAIRLEGT